MAEVEIERAVVPSGYEYEFISTVYDEFYCLICHLPLREPVLTRCGRRYCRKCLDEAIKRLPFPQCPVDREMLDPEKDIFPDKATERNILSCHVKCPSEGCEWTGEIRYVEKHASECQKFPTDCSNGCGEVIAREEISNHIKNDCPLTLVSCLYVEMGCETKVQRKKMNCHLQATTVHHLDLACVKLHNTQVQLNDTQDQLNDTQDQLKSTQQTTKELAEKVDTLQRQLKEKLDEKQLMQINKGKCFMWKIDNFSDILRQAKTGQNCKIESVPFYTESCGYKLKVLFYPNGNGRGENTHVSVFKSAVKGEYDAVLQWPLQIGARLTLIDQQCDALHRENVELYFTQTINRPNEDGATFRGLSKFVSHEKLNTRRYLVDDTLFLQVEIGPTVNELKSWSTSSLQTFKPIESVRVPGVFTKPGRRSITD